MGNHNCCYTIKQPTDLVNNNFSSLPSTNQNALNLALPASNALLNRRNTWLQLAGHPGSFAPAGPKTVWKRQPAGENAEIKTYQSLMEDEMRNMVPKFHREVEHNGEKYIELEDLLHHFHDPNIMDIKMGTRTFGEGEVKNPADRNDLYEKMVKIDPTEPTQDEHDKAAITKLRYMQFREKESSTATLGSRIEALRLQGENPNKDLKKVKTKEEVSETIFKFTQGNKCVCNKFLSRLREIRSHFESSEYFKNHEIIGSSLLFLYDKDNQANIWMIDFAKTISIKDGKLNHRSEWRLGNHEDGYLIGLDNLIQIFEELCSRNSTSNSANCNDNNHPPNEAKQ